MHQRPGTEAGAFPNFPHCWQCLSWRTAQLLLRLLGGMGGGEGFWMSKTMPKHTNTAGRKGDQMKYVMILSAPKLPNSHRKLPFQDRVPKKKNETSSQLFANKDSYR